MENLQIQQGQSLDEFLWRLGSLKKEKTIQSTWQDLAAVLNDQLGVNYGQSFWRKRYKKMVRAAAVPETPIINTYNIDEVLKANFIQMQKRRIRQRDQRRSFGDMIRRDARKDDFLTLLKEQIQKIEPIAYNAPQKASDTPVAVYAMLSDIHYGMTFTTPYSAYNSSIAQQRVMNYANKIKQIGNANGATVCYVSLMGDMISGSIHQTIRIENRQNIIQQIVGVSQLVSTFLLDLSSQFQQVIVNSVSGNHSRIQPNLQNALRGQRLDNLIPWYCKARLSACDRIKFANNDHEQTFGMFTIFGKNYVSVHGDMDNDLNTSAVRISNLIGQRIDYFLAGHMHIADVRMQNIGLIRNGAVVTGGDEYTAKKRLFGPAVQVCMTVTPDGVEAIHPVRLS